MSRREKGALAAAFIIALALHGGLAAFQLPAFFPAQSFYIHSSDALQVSFAVGAREDGAVADDPVQGPAEPSVVEQEAAGEAALPPRPEIASPVTKPKPEQEPRREPLVQKEPVAPVSPEPGISAVEKKDLEKQEQRRVPSATSKDGEDQIMAGADSAPVVGKEPAEKTIVPAVPRYRDNPPPRYPPSALRRGQEGLVLLSVTVGVDGRPREVALKESSGYDSLDRSAIASVRNWRFDPATSRGIAIEMTVDVPIRFEMKQDRW